MPRVCALPALSLIKPLYLTRCGTGAVDCASMCRVSGIRMTRSCERIDKSGCFWRLANVVRIVFLRNVSNKSREGRMAFPVKFRLAILLLQVRALGSAEFRQLGATHFPVILFQLG